jgi:hypothetical protein
MQDLGVGFTSSEISYEQWALSMVREFQFQTHKISKILLPTRTLTINSMPQIRLSPRYPSAGTGHKTPHLK